MQLSKSDILKLVKVRKENTFWNHFLYNSKTDYKIYGKVEKNNIKIWQKTTFAGAFYPVYSFDFNSEQELIKITDKLNPFAQVLRLLFPCIYFFPLISTSLTNFEFKRFLGASIVFLILTLICYLVSNKIYLFEKKEQLNDFYKTLGIKTEEVPEREWSKNKILTRLFTYPFCFALLLVNIFLIIPEGKFLLSIPIFGIVGVYLYSDLKMIFKDKK